MTQEEPTAAYNCYCCVPAGWAKQRDITGRSKMAPTDAAMGLGGVTLWVMLVLLPLLLLPTSLLPHPLLPPLLSALVRQGCMHNHIMPAGLRVLLPATMMHVCGVLTVATNSGRKTSQIDFWLPIGACCYWCSTHPTYTFLPATAHCPCYCHDDSHLHKPASSSIRVDYNTGLETARAQYRVC